MPCCWPSTKPIFRQCVRFTRSVYCGFCVSHRARACLPLLPALRGLMTDTRTERHADAERLIALLSERASAPETLAEADWRRIVELAQEQGVAPMLYARLQTLGATLPAATAQQLREFYLACVMRNTWLFDEVGKILRALQAAGIPGQAVWQLLRRDKTLTAEARQEAHLRV